MGITIWHYPRLSRAAVAVVLLDLRDHPVEFAGGDVRAAVLALPRLGDLQWGAAVAAGRHGDRRGSALGGADQRPVFAVRAIAMAGPAHVLAAGIADHVVPAAAPEPDGDRVVVSIA